MGQFIFAIIFGVLLISIIAAITTGSETIFGANKSSGGLIKLGIN